MPSTITPEHTAWCRRHFDMLRAGGIWAVPRSGLMFTRRGDTLALTMFMSWSEDIAAASRRGEDVPSSAEELIAYQREDFEDIRQQFAAADVTVEDAAGLLPVDDDSWPYDP